VRGCAAPPFSRPSGGRVPVALGAHKSNSFLGISPSPRARVRAFELPRVLLHFDHVAGLIVNANHSIV
jgi:hypothetical protein